MKHSTFRKQSFIKFALDIFLVLFFAIAYTGCDSKTEHVRFGSGNMGGFYSKYAASLANTVSAPDSNIIVKTTAGSAANIRLMEEGFIDLGIVQADVLKDYLMKNRTRHAITALAGLYTESIQIVVAAESDIKTISDLQGRKVSVGEEESGVIRNAEIILDAYGISFDKIQAEKLSFKESADALKAGKIEAFFCTAGIPTPSITRLSKSMNVRILSLDSAETNRIMNLHEEFAFSQIPANTYAGQDSAVQTIGTKAILVANQMLDSAPIEKCLKNLFENKKLSEEVPVPSLKFATTNIPVEFHPAAVSFYAVKGFKVQAAAPLQGRGPIPSTGD